VARAILLKPVQKEAGTLLNKAVREIYLLYLNIIVSAIDV